MGKVNLLIVEDHHALAVAVAAAAERSGLQTQMAPNLARARQMLDKQAFNGLLLDIGLPDGHGLDLVKEWKWSNKPEIAVITAHGEIDNAIAARKMGVSHFFDKPVDFGGLQQFFDGLSAHGEVDEKESLEAGANPSPFVGASAVMRPVFRQISHACASSQPVVVRGATGTGKTKVAQLICKSSGDDQPNNLIHASPMLDGSELADAIKSSSRGVLIIESIGSLSMDLQTMLARLLDEMSDGSPRIIVTTGDEGLYKHVNDGKFLQDLYYRLQILEVALPPLRERLDDIPAISDCFLGELGVTSATKIDQGVLEVFANYEWPGNLRELRNVINFAHVTSAGAPIITTDHIPDHLAGVPLSRGGEGKLNDVLESWVNEQLENTSNYKDIITDLEGTLLNILLKRYDGKPSRLAAALSINRSTLRKKLKGE